MLFSSQHCIPVQCRKMMLFLPICALQFLQCSLESTVNFQILRLRHIWKAEETFRCTFLHLLCIRSISGLSLHRCLSLGSVSHSGVSRTPSQCTPVSHKHHGNAWYGAAAGSPCSPHPLQQHFVPGQEYLSDDTMLGPGLINSAYPCSLSLPSFHGRPLMK